MVDDVDTIYPSITFKEDSKQDKGLTRNRFNWDKPDKDVKVEPLKRKVENVTEQNPQKIDILGLLHRK